MAALREYLYIAVLGGICGFFYAFGIGANDVANAFASTVASKSLTLKQAVIVAGIFEFLGALLLGASVTTTIRSKIFDPALYADEPEIVLLGMFTSLLTGTVMLLGATALALPVSTTHTIVGSIMGFTIAAKGFSSVNVEVVVKIIISWLISPLVSGILAFLFFISVRMFVLRKDNPFMRAYYTFPIVLTIGIGIDLFYVLYKGFKNTSFGEDLRLAVVLPVSFAVGFVCGLIWIFLVGPVAKKRVEAHNAERGTEEGESEDRNNEEEEVDLDEVYDVANAATKDKDKSLDEEAQEEDQELSSTELEPTEQHDQDEDQPVEAEKQKNFFKRAATNFAKNTYDQDLHMQSMHESAVRFIFKGCPYTS